MTPATLAHAAAVHARLILEARTAEALASRGGQHAEREACDAETRRAEARALAELLAPFGVEPAAEGQMSLFSDGRL